MVVPLFLLFLFVCLFFFSFQSDRSWGSLSPADCSLFRHYHRCTTYTRGGLHGVEAGKGGSCCLAFSQVVGFAWERQSSMSSPFCEHTFPFDKDYSFTPSQMLLWPLRTPLSSACHRALRALLLVVSLRETNIAYDIYLQNDNGCTWV